MAEWNRETVGTEILVRRSAGSGLSYGEMQREDPRLLRAALRYFGSWQRAVESAGLDYSEIRRYRAWTRERILEQIRLYHAAGEDLDWRNVSTTLDPALAAAAIRANRFGNWKAALAAAGLES